MNRRNREQPPAIVVLFCMFVVILLLPAAIIKHMKEFDTSHNISCPRIVTTIDHVAYYWLMFTLTALGFFFFIILTALGM